jgi:hypothetical protein
MLLRFALVLALLLAVAGAQSPAYLPGASFDNPSYLEGFGWFWMGSQPTIPQTRVFRLPGYFVAQAGGVIERVAVSSGRAAPPRAVIGGTIALDNPDIFHDLVIGIGHLDMVDTEDFPEGHLIQLPTIDPQGPNVLATGRFLGFTILYDGRGGDPVYMPDAGLEAWRVLRIPGLPFYWDGVHDVGLYFSWTAKSGGDGSALGFRTAIDGGADIPAYDEYGTGPFFLASTAQGGASGLPVALNPPMRVNIHEHGWIGAQQIDVTTIDISPLPEGTTQGWLLPSANTYNPQGTGPVFGLDLDPVTMAVLTAFPLPQVGNLVHWQVVPGEWPDYMLVLENLMHPSFAGLTWDFIAIAQDASGAILEVSPVERHTWQTFTR